MVKNENIVIDKTKILFDLFEDKFDSLSAVKLVKDLTEAENMFYEGNNDVVERNRFPLLCFENKNDATSIDFSICAGHGLQELYLGFHTFGNSSFKTNKSFYSPTIVIPLRAEESSMKDLLHSVENGFVDDLKSYFSDTKHKFDKYNTDDTDVEISIFTNSEIGGLIEEPIPVFQPCRFIVSLRSEYLNSAMKEDVDFETEDSVVFIDAKIGFGKQYVNIIYDNYLWSIPKDVFKEEYDSRNTKKDYNLTYATWDLCEV